MNQFLKIFVFVLSVNIMALAGFYSDKENHTLSTQDCPDALTLTSKVKAGFIESYTETYKDIPLNVLKVKNVLNFLENAFQEEIDDFGKSGVREIVVTDDNSNIIGYFSFDILDERRKTSMELEAEYKNFPPRSAYIRQLFVLPDYQRRGIASLMINKMIYDCYPGLEHIYVACRRINYPAQALYTQTQFKETSLKLHGLSEDTYISYER